MYLPEPRQDPEEQNGRVHKDSHKLMNKVKMAVKNETTLSDNRLQETNEI